MARNEEVKIKLSAEFEAKGVQQGAAQVQAALDQTEKAFEKTELASKSLQKSIEQTGKNTQGFSKALGKVKTPKGVKGLSKSIGKAGLAGAFKVGALAAGSLVAGVGAAAVGLGKLGKASKASHESLKAYKGGLSAIQQATSGTTEEMSALDGIIRDLGARTGEDIGNVSQYVSQFAALGIGQKEATEAVTAALNVAKTTGKDTGRVVTALMSSYKGSASEAEKLGINVQGLTKEQLISGEAVERIQEAYGETLSTAAQLTEAEIETNRHLQEAEEIKSNMWTQAEGLRETWNLVQLAISKIKVIALKAFQPMVRHINFAVKMAFNLRKSFRLSAAVLDKVFSTVLARATEGYADMFDFLTGWSSKALSLIGVSVDVISNKLRDVSDDLYSRADAASARAEKLRGEIRSSLPGAGSQGSEGPADDTSGLSNVSTRVFTPKRATPKKEKSEKDDFWDRWDKKMDELIKIALKERADAEAVKEREANVLAEILAGEQELIDEREQAIQDKWVEITDIYTRTLKSDHEMQVELHKKAGISLDNLIEANKETVEGLEKMTSVWEHIKKEWKTEITEPFKKGLKNFAEGTTHYDNAGSALKSMLKGGIKNALKGGVKKLASAGIGAMKNIGSMAAQAPAMMAAKVAEALKNLIKNIFNAAIQGSENIVAPSELAEIDQSTKEGQLAYLEATEANSQAGQDAAEGITKNLLNEISPVLGSLFEALLTDPEKLDAFFENLTAGFTIMIERIAENVGPIVETLAKNMPRVVRALVKALPILLKVVVKHLPAAVEILVFEIVKALPDIVTALLELMWLGMKHAVIEIPKLIWKIFSGLGRGIGSLFGFGRSPSPPSSYESAGIAPPPQNLAQFQGVQNDAARLRKEIADADDDDKDKETKKPKAKLPPRIAPITIGGVARTDKTLTAAEAFNPYVNEDFTKEAKQPVKIQIQIGDQSLREIITDLQETGYPTVVTA